MVNGSPIINAFINWFKNEHKNTHIPRYMTNQLLQLNNLKQFCLHFPTCDGCPFREKHKGCMFRSKTPREW